jgi:hypothetical protein
MSTGFGADGDVRSPARRRPGCLIVPPWVLPRRHPSRGPRRHHRQRLILRRSLFLVCGLGRVRRVGGASVRLPCRRLDRWPRQRRRRAPTCQRHQRRAQRARRREELASGLALGALARPGGARQAAASAEVGPTTSVPPRTVRSRHPLRSRERQPRFVRRHPCPCHPGVAVCEPRWAIRSWRLRRRRSRHRSRHR